MDPTFLTDHPIVEVEEDLQIIPTELYYSHRVRAHEKALQRGLLHTPFDLCSENEVLNRHALFKTKTPNRTMGQDSGTGVDDQRGINGETLNAIELVLRGSANDKGPLLAVSDALAREGLHYLFHVVARLGSKDIVELMLEAGMDVNTQDQNGATPLIAACRGGHADIRVGLSSFHWLLMYEDSDVSWILEKMRSIHNSVVMDSVMAEPFDLLEHGLRLRWSPVHFAVEVRNMTVTKALLDAGASVRAGNTTPFNIAVATHCPEMTKLLLAHGMPEWQRTPFLYIGEVSTFKLLLLHGDQRRRNLYDTDLKF
ncbi:MAG: hypothetical protein Q9192_005823 [Flavoplaca navasiana]